jgi:hypothetical protein
VVLRCRLCLGCLHEKSAVCGSSTLTKTFSFFRLLPSLKPRYSSALNIALILPFGRHEIVLSCPCLNLVVILLFFRPESCGNLVAFPGSLSLIFKLHEKAQGKPRLSVIHLSSRKPFLWPPEMPKCDLQPYPYPTPFYGVQNVQNVIFNPRPNLALFRERNTTFDNH